MNMVIRKSKQICATLLSTVLAFGVSTAEATIDGITGTTFDLTASAGRISTADGNSVYFWGFGETGGTVQYPGPTLIVNQGDTITINLTNALDVPTSITFPGQGSVTASGGVAGDLAQEAAAVGGTVSYTFTATHPGTYLYQSGSNQELQIEMGLFGAIVVRPPQAGQAYNHSDSAFDREYLYLMSEMDLDIHEAVEKGVAPDLTNPYLEYWFINGRTAVDTLFPAGAPWLPTQPYNILPLMHPGERLLLRVITAGRDSHPLHPHGNNFEVIARDGRLLSSAPGAGADLAYSDYTVQVDPGATVDFIFQWTGDKLGYDIYGHDQGKTYAECMANTVMEPHEDEESHCRSLSDLVQLPQVQDLTIGGFYSGSPFLGSMGALPPGEGGLNPFDGYFFPWHSHHEKELTNFDIYPGGLLTFFAVVPWDFPLE